MTPPPFIFNHKTGELTRNGKMVPLGELHCKMFACFAIAQAPIGCGAIARTINLPVHAIENEMQRFCKRLRLVDISIASSRGHHGKWLVFEDAQKWKPTIPDPVRLEGEVP